MVLPRDMWNTEYQTNPLLNGIFAEVNQNGSLSRDENSLLVPSETHKTLYLVPSETRNNARFAKIKWDT